MTSEPPGLTALKRPIYLVAGVFGSVVVALAILVQPVAEVGITIGYVALLLILLGLTIGLWRGWLAVRVAERVLLVALVVITLGRLLAVLYGGASLADARVVVTESVAPVLSATVVLLYLALPSRLGLRLSIALVGLFGAVVLPRVAQAFVSREPDDTEVALAMLRMGAAVAAIGGLVYALAVLGERYGETLARLADAERQAGTDAVTGAPNRRAVTAALEQQLAFAHRFGTSLCVVLIDLDGFKALNDGYGHEAGDAALHRVVESLDAELRGADLVGRWGGDEFVVLLPGTDLLAAVPIIDRLRRAVAELSVAEGPGSLTASLGLAELGSVDTATSLVARADQAMYAAKAAGGDRVVIASPMAPGRPSQDGTEVGSASE